MNSTKNRPKRINRFLKFLLWTVGIFASLLLLLYLVILIFFPADRIRQLAVNYLASTLNRQVQIEKARINIFTGLELENLILYEMDSLQTAPNDKPPAFISIQQVTLKYKLWPLLHRQVLIREITIDSPRVQLFTDQNGNWNFQDLLPVESDSLPEIEPETAADTSEFSLPVSIQLERFELNNLHFDFSLLTDSTALQLTLDKLTGKISGLEIPAGLEQKFLAQTQFSSNLLLEDARLNLAYTAPADSLDLHISTIANLEIQSQFQGLHHITSNSLLQLKDFSLFETTPIFQSADPQSGLLKLQIQTVTNLTDGEINISDLRLDIVEQLLAQGSGTISQIFDEPNIDFTIDQSEVDAAGLMQLAAQLKMPELKSLLDSLSVSGTFSLAGTTISGNPLGEAPPEGLQLQARLALAHIFLTYGKNFAQVRDLNFNLAAQAGYSLVGFDNLSAAGNIFSPYWKIALDDTLSIDGKNFTLDFSTRLTGNFLPGSIDLTAKIADVWNSQIYFETALDSVKSQDNYRLNGRLQIQNLHLAQLEIPELTGKSDLELKFASTSLNDSRIRLKAQFDSLNVLMETGWETLPNQTVTTTLNVKTDTLLEDFSLDSIKLTINDYFQLHGRGVLNGLGTEGFQLTITQARVDNQKLYGQLPEIITGELGDLEISGHSNLTGQFSGEMPAEDSLWFHGKFFLNTQNTDVDYPDIFLKAWNIQLNTTLDLYPDSLTAFIETGVDSFALTDLRRQPFRKNYLTANLRMPRFERIIFSACSARVEELNTTVVFSGKIDSLETEPVIFFTTSVDFNNPAPVEVIDDLKLQGKAKTNARIYIHKNLLVVNAELDLNPLDMFYLDLLTAHGIRGTVQLKQKIDIEALHFIREELPLFASTQKAGLGYDYLRPYFQHLSQPIPTVRIEKIKILDYEVYDILFDILLGGARLDIPHFFLRAYEGNAQGQCGLTIGEGSFEDPEILLDSTRFQLRATFSNINTAKLNPVISAKAKKSKVNGNLALVGEGLNPEGELAITGELNITKIGPKVTDNLLRSLDPMGVDQGIQSVRQMLKLSFKPKLLSFEIKHGHFYPTIRLSKPFYLPVNIAGGGIELARMPIEIFLKQALATQYYVEY